MAALFCNTHWQTCSRAKIGFIDYGETWFTNAIMIDRPPDKVCSHLAVHSSSICISILSAKAVEL